MSRDVRVLIVKLADRLHNMRTLSHIPNEAKRRAHRDGDAGNLRPLARRIGMEKMARELESLAFHEAFPMPKPRSTLACEQLRLEKGANVAIIIQTIMEVFEFAGIDARVFGREKQPYSIWRKLQRKSMEFSDLADVYAFRVIVNNPDDCYRALGLDPPDVALRAGSGGRLYLNAEAQRLSLDPHHRDRPRQRARRNPDPHRGDGSDSPKSASPRIGATRTKPTASMKNWRRPRVSMRAKRRCSLLEIAEHGGDAERIPRARQARNVFRITSSPLRRRAR